MPHDLVGGCTCIAPVSDRVWTAAPGIVNGYSHRAGRDTGFTWFRVHGHVHRAAMDKSRSVHRLNVRILALSTAIVSID